MRSLLVLLLLGTTAFAGQATLEFKAKVISAQGTRTINPTSLTINPLIEATTVVDLQTGLNTVTRPTGATALLFIPPATNAVGLTLQGADADTGFSIAPSRWLFLPFGASAPASVKITADDTVTGCQFLWF